MTIIIFVQYAQKIQCGTVDVIIFVHYVQKKGGVLNWTMKN